jgi:type I restriction enzyme M protein
LVRNDKRWVYGTPPPANGNFAWIQHFLWHLAPTGSAGFILANGSLSVQGVEGEIRRKLVEADLVDCIVTLPTNLFFGTTIPVSLWFLSKSRTGNGQRARKGEILFIDARSLGHMATRAHRVLSATDIRRVAEVYRSWKSKSPGTLYADEPDFAKSVSTEEVRRNRYVLAPGRYVRDESDSAGSADAVSVLAEERDALLDEAEAAAGAVRNVTAGLRRVSE